MKLFYGADKLVSEPKYNFGNPSNDYGLGLYLTPDIDMARLWASKNPKGGFCITYDVNLSAMQVLRLDDASESSVLAWIAILVQHRFSKEEYEANKQAVEWLRNTYVPDLSGADIILGYRADDSYFAYSRDFVRNDLSLETLSQAMRLGNLGLQYVLKSRTAFAPENIRMVRYEEVGHSDEYEAFRRSARAQYRLLRSEDDINNTYIRDLMRQKGAGEK